MQNTAHYTCADCGERIVRAVDITAGAHQAFIEDCPVCCRPQAIRLEIDPHGRIQVESHRE